MSVSGKRIKLDAMRNANRGRTMAQKDIADVLGVSRQAIQNIELRALRKIRKAIENDPEIMQWLRESTNGARGQSA